MVSKEKLTFGLIIGVSDIHNSESAQVARTILLEKMDGFGYDHIILPFDQTSEGNIKTIKDAQKCADLFNQNRDKIDGIIVVLSKSGSEQAIINALNMAKLNVPLLVQSCDDDNDKLDVYSRRDTFSSKLSLCRILYKYGIAFTDTIYHTYPIDSELFYNDINKFAAVCRIVGRVKRSRIGVIGKHPGSSDESILQSYGITLIPADISEIVDMACKFGDNTIQLQGMIARISNYGKIESGIESQKVTSLARFVLALENWISQNNIDALVIQCWDALYDEYSCNPYPAMSMISDKLIPSVCGVDISSVLSMYVLALAAGSPAANLDWKNNFAEDRNMCVCAHSAGLPKSFMGITPDIGISISEGTFGTVKGKIAPGAVTFCRILADNTKGIIKSYLGEGEITNDPYGLDDGVAVVRIPSLQKLMKFCCKNGFGNNIAMVRGNVADVVEEAVTTYLDWDLYRND